MLNPVFRRHLPWTEASESYTRNSLHGFAAIISRQNLCERALSCFILTKRTALPLLHISVSLGFRFVCLCLGWPQPRCLQNPSAPTDFAALRKRSAGIHRVLRSNTSLPFLRPQRYSQPPQPSRRRVPSRLSQAHRTKPQSKTHENKRCSSAGQGGIETGRTGLLSWWERNSCPSALV